MVLNVFKDGEREVGGKNKSLTVENQRVTMLETETKKFL
jgi:hypothetical protein